MDIAGTRCPIHFLNHWHIAVLNGVSPDTPLLPHSHDGAVCVVECGDCLPSASLPLARPFCLVLQAEALSNHSKLVSAAVHDIRIATRISTSQLARWLCFLESFLAPASFPRASFVCDACFRQRLLPVLPPILRQASRRGSHDPRHRHGWVAIPLTHPVSPLLTVARVFRGLGLQEARL